MIDYVGLTYLELAASAVVFIILMKISAPYGRFIRKGWGPGIKARWAWVIMESPAVVWMIYLFIRGNQFGNSVSWLFLILWQMHYLHRAFVYPFRFGSGKKPFPLVLVLFAIIFNSLNGYINGVYLFIGHPRDISWFTDIRFVTGTLLFITGFLINKHSDGILRNLKPSSDERYNIPKGGLFKFVSSAHYFGEIVEWIGWAVLTWSLPGLAFAMFTSANLVPRALFYHKWYKKNFTDYPTDRKAIFPYLL